MKVLHLKIILRSNTLSLQKQKCLKHQYGELHKNK